MTGTHSLFKEVMQLSYKALYNSWFCGCSPQPLASLLSSREFYCKTLASLVSQVIPGMLLATSSIPQFEPTPAREGGRIAWGRGDGRGLYRSVRRAETPKMATGSSLVSEGQWRGPWAEVWGLLAWRLIRGVCGWIGGLGLMQGKLEVHALTIPDPPLIHCMVSTKSSFCEAGWLARVVAGSLGGRAGLEEARAPAPPPPPLPHGSTAKSPQPDLAFS